MTQMADGLAAMNEELHVSQRLPLDYVNQQTASAAPTKVPANLSRGQILDATLSCLLESGYDGTTIRKIAKRLDCAVGSIYRYFKDKRELLDAVLQRRFEPVLEQLEVHHTVRPSVSAYVRIAMEEPTLYQLMFWIASDPEAKVPQIPGVIGEVIDAWGDRFTQEDFGKVFWAKLHGTILVNSGLDDVIAAMEFPSEKHATSSPKPPAPRLTPVVVQSSPPPPRMGGGIPQPKNNMVQAGYADKDHEDVTLL
ncbi:TetR/AcrR family transcriptional regulator [Planctomycetota bacterium]|nr:TetR/AcrR family transcriptional regulator [Planctomycetota bacterium]